MNVDYSASKTQSWLSWFFRGVLVLGFLVLLGRLFELQIVKGAYYLSIAEDNRIRRIPITAARGQILARGGEALVGNVPITRRVILDAQAGYTKTDDLTNASQDEVVVDSQRVYKLGPAAGHLTGYLGEANEQEVGKVDPSCLTKGAVTLGALVGRAGLEQFYNCSLSGVDGERLVEVDASGAIVRNIGSFDPVAGVDIKTTIHYGLQQVVGGLMDGRRGAIVVTDTAGQVLALYSSPAYDPTDFLEGNAKAAEVLASPDLPLFNRAVGGTFHPGSIYKPIVATAALEEDAIAPDFSYTDTGSIVIDDFSYTNWYFTQYGRTEGEIGLQKALARSTDTFFYKVGELTGIDAIAKWSKDFGLETKTGIDLPNEVAGLVPSPSWKKRTKGERWYLGNTYHVSIGQGDLAVTPIAINEAISAIATSGHLCRPYINQMLGAKCEELTIDPQTITQIKTGMVEACQPGGTGFTFFDFVFPGKTLDDANPLVSRVACKTGTAETGVGDQSHAWFVAYGPADFPEIVVTVLLEEGGSGSEEAGPIARKVFDYWFIDRVSAKQ